MALKRSFTGMRTAMCLTIAVVCACNLSNAWGDPTPAPKKPENQPEKAHPKKKDTDKSKGKDKEAKKKMPALQFKMKDINGKEQDLTQYYGNVVLMVNVASKCGLTPQYEELEKTYKKYKDKGFVILGFPANNFLRQEPGTDDEIKAFCKKNYGVTFPMFSKVSVKGKDKCELYQYLTDKKAGHKFGGAIEWNFAKFIINRNGEIAERFSPRTTPDDKKLIAALEKELDAPIPADSPLARKKSEKPEEKPAPTH